MAYHINLDEPIYFTPPPVRGRYVNGLHKGGSAPKPDPQIGKAALQTAAIGRDAFEFYKQEYINNKPAQDKLNASAIAVQEQLLASSKSEAARSDEYYNYMKDTFRPLEKDIVDNANAYDTAGRREQEAGKGVADVRQAFDTQRGMTMRANERAGVNPNSGNAQALGAQVDVQEAIASSNAANTGRSRAEMTGMALKSDAANMGRNLPGNALASTQAANQAASGSLSAGIAGQQSNLAAANQYGQGASLGMQGYNSQANILNNQYNSQVQAYQAQQASNDSQWAGIGSLVGIGAAMMMKDGGLVNPEVNPQQVAMQPRRPVTIENETGAVHEGAGHVRGAGTATSDSIDAKLSNNEYVLNEGAVKMFGVDALDAINQRGLQFRSE